MEMNDEEKVNRGEERIEEIHRITVLKSAEEALTAMVERVNEGYDGGKVNRTQVANWILLNAQENLSEAQVQQIRAEYLDEFAYLESLVKKAKKAGKLPPELRSFMNKQLGIDDAPKKRKKNLKTDVPNGDVRIDDIV